MTIASPQLLRGERPAPWTPTTCLVPKNANLVVKSRPAKASSETVRTCPMGSRTPARTPLRSVTQLDDRRRRNGSLGQKRNPRPNLFSAVDRDRLFRVRDRLARSLLAHSVHAA